MKKLTDSQLEKHLFKNTRAKASAADIKNQISHLNMAVKVFNSEFETRFLISDYLPKSKNLLAVYNLDLKRVVLNKMSFTNPNVFAAAILHEISHAIGTKDYFYYNRFVESYPPMASYKSEMAMLDNYTKQTRKFMTRGTNGGFVATGFGDHLMSHFKVPETLFYDEKIEFVAEAMKFDPTFRESHLLNNADTLSVYLMTLAGLGKKKSTWPRKAIENSLKDTVNIFSTDEAKEFSKYGTDWEAHLDG